MLICFCSVLASSDHILDDESLDYYGVIIDSFSVRVVFVVL
jgi:hypothetical protein